MDMALPPGDQISRLLHVVVIEICQRIVSYTDELVVSGMVFVKADGVQVCRIPFDDAIKANVTAASSDENHEIDKLPSRSDNPKPHVMVGPDLCDDRVTPSRNLCERRDRSSTMNSSSVAGKTAGCFAEGSTEGSGRYKRIFKCKEFGSLNGFVVNVNGGCSSSVSNLGEMVMECWRQITPELLKASAMLCTLGELQKAMDAQIVSRVDDRRVSTKKINTGVVRSKISNGDLPPARSSFLQALGSDFRVRNQCRLCQKVFTFPTNLRRHQRNFHGRPLSRDTRRGNSSRSAFSGARSLADVTKLVSRRANPVVSDKHSGLSVPRTIESVATEHSTPPGEVVDQELDVNSASAIDRQGTTNHSNANLENTTGRTSVALVACPDEELVVDDIYPAEENNLGGDSVSRALSVSVDTVGRENGFREKQKAFDTVDVVGGHHECYAFNDCSCWDKSGDSMLDPISVDVSDGVPKKKRHLVHRSVSNEGHVERGSYTVLNKEPSSKHNSEHCFEDCCSLDGSSGRATSGCVRGVLTADIGTFHKTLITDAITVGSPDSSRSVEVEEPPRMKKFQCLMCDASFSMSNNLQRHVRKSHGTTKDSSRLQPRKAPVAFESALDGVLNCASSARDSKTMLSSRYRHICIVCGAAFTFRTNLTRHMKKIHHQIPLDVAAAESSSPDRPKDGSSSPKL